MPSIALCISGSYLRDIDRDTPLDFPHVRRASLFRVVEHNFIGHISHHLDKTAGKYVDGYITDMYGAAKITQFQFVNADMGNPFGFTKQYPDKDWVLRHDFTKKKGKCWHGTWEAGKETDGKFMKLEGGPARCLLTPVF